MAKLIVDDMLWNLIEPLLPAPKPRRFRYPGRKPVSNRQALTGILFVLKSGIPWEMLPQELGCGCGMTCWRRLRDWAKAVVWDRLHRASLDAASVPAKKGAPKPGRIRRIAANRARSATLWPTGGASRSPACSPRPT